ncbi:16S rRNA (cytosine(1402)-N(4))-methyltransferase RsmH [Lacibacter luteus]|uniref:Ribosomal RNA small subunit methyltransferase H n=1 Tax=Lacibacter luteus TaxID=2508719 RepID=A0A4Q1CF17_9BACT|nr:16S rRNA (cytosine(1402)-N(4))-methyltransferase RsmH [Lacibacter luteus]RXK58455.1 16S rRNA (cytosine(1402)-N(4))-methyltransferase RsmH [Lacibacter luteus]
MAKQKHIPTADEGQANQQQDVYHVPVMLNETVDALNIQSDGVYVDCTFGGGGHSREILKRLGKNGKLVAFDQDPDAKRNLPDDERIVFVPHNFKHLSRFLKLNGFSKVDGVMADLGVSSHQFDEGARGFSTRFDGPLDMRMDPSQPVTAATILQTYSQQQLHKLFEQYGEVTNAKTLAATIVQQRSTNPFQTIEHLKQALQPVVKGNPNKYFAQVFQALRIEVNDELGVLKELLEQLPAVLKPKGRAAIISFHSLEDRLVKNFFKKGSFEEESYNPFDREVKEQVFHILSKKPIEASAEELKRNSRSRSARLRVAEKL